MRLFMITVRDSAAESYHAPLFVPALGLGERWFRDEVNSGNSDIAKHPSDFELYVLGTFDNITCEVELDSPRLLMRGVDAVKAAT